MILFFTQHLYFTYASIIFLGLCIGSFLNVVIYRLPKIILYRWRLECAEALELPAAANEHHYAELSLSRPASHCVHCQKPLPWWQNIPLLSFILLKGRCYFCGAPISYRYPLVECLSAFIAVWVFYTFGFSFKSLAGMVFCWHLLALTFIDMDYLILPDDMTLLLLWLGLLVNTRHILISPEFAILGAAIGYSFLWIVAHGFKWVTGIEGMGYGDFKLTAAIGAWLGWSYLPLVLLIASAIGLIVGLVFLARKHLPIRTPIAFGPCLAIAGMLALFLPGGSL